MLITYAPAVDRTKAAGSEIRHSNHIAVKAGSYRETVQVLINYALPYMLAEYFFKLLLSSADFFKKSTFSKNSNRNTI